MITHRIITAALCEEVVNIFEGEKTWGELEPRYLNVYYENCIHNFQDVQLKYYAKGKIGLIAALNSIRWASPFAFLQGLGKMSTKIQPIKRITNGKYLHNISPDL